MSNLLRKPKVLQKSGHKHATFEARIRAGLFVPPVKISQRSSAWPEDEVDRINAAVVAGKTPEQLRELVKKLVADRKLAA